MTKIIINGIEVEADPGKPLIAACHAHGEEVPNYCYHPGLTPVGSCRICQVEVKQGEMPPRIVVACRTPVVAGMVVDTEAPKAHQARRECLEFLLKNHPLDCPICDKAGECDLQDYAFEEGQGMARTVEPRRKLEKRKSLGDVIVLDQERCILCSRCVRFMEEVPRSPQLVVSQRGADSVIETFMDRPLSGNYQGNLADVCPVGALTLKPFRFQARVWNLRKVASTCAECSRGCAITVETLRRGPVKRFRPRYEPEVNDWWMCDVGRFAFEPADREGRLAGAAIRRGKGFVAADTADALEGVRDMLAVHQRRQFVLSPFLTCEEAMLLKSLAESLEAPLCFVSPEPNGLADDLLHTGDPCPNRRGLEELGIPAKSAAEALELLAGAEIGIAVGDRIEELLGGQELAALPTTGRLALFTTHLFALPAANVVIGMPNHVERSGTWVNVDGHRGRIQAARPAPAGVWQLDRALATLVDLLAQTRAEA